MYEHRLDPKLSRGAFAHRVIRHALIALALVLLVLTLGIFGYHILAHLGWVDSLLNASMILGGMGPVSPLETTGAKIFASFYALFSGLLFVAIASVIVAPFAHRLLHSLHVEED